MPADFHQIDWDATIEDDLRHLVRLAVARGSGRPARLDDGRTRRARYVGAGPQWSHGKQAWLRGLRALPVIVDEMHAQIDVELAAEDGREIAAGSVLVQFSGSARDLLTCEQPMLNFMSRLSGNCRGTNAAICRTHRQHASAPDLRHMKNDARLAAIGKMRRAVRRRVQPPHGIVRRNSDQGQPLSSGRRKTILRQQTRFVAGSQVFVEQLRRAVYLPKRC